MKGRTTTKRRRDYKGTAREGGQQDREEEEKKKHFRVLPVLVPVVVTGQLAYLRHGVPSWEREGSS